MLFLSQNKHKKHKQTNIKTDNRFILKQMGPRVVALPSESLPLDIFEDVPIPSIPQLM